MSLRYFHFFFILISMALCASVAWWGFENNADKGFIYGFVSASAILPVYGLWFMKKSRKLV